MYYEALHHMQHSDIANTIRLPYAADVLNQSAVLCARVQRH